MSCNASSAALCPWNVKNPAGELIALTEDTKDILLHELYKSQAVWAYTVNYSFWTYKMLSGFWGSGIGCNPYSTFIKSAWLGEQAY
jgi:hypothetical protein